MPRPAIRACRAAGRIPVRSGSARAAKSSIAPGVGIGVGQPASRAGSRRRNPSAPVGAAPADLEAEREGAVGHRAERHRRLADAAALRVALSSRPSASSWRMITETVCADSPVRRAISAFATLRWRRISDRIEALVVEAHADLVGAAAEAGGAAGLRIRGGRGGGHGGRRLLQRTGCGAPALRSRRPRPPWRGASRSVKIIKS